VTNSVGQTAIATRALVVRSPPKHAIVAGYVQVCGGPAPGGCRIGKLGLCQPPRGCVTTDRVAAINSSGRRVAVAKLIRGRFRLALQPGPYTIELLADGKHLRGRILQRKRAVARRHRTATVRFFFAVP
jgi:hypothetical protein